MTAKSISTGEAVSTGSWGVLADGLLISASLATGFGLGRLVAWQGEIRSEGLTAGEIFIHNASLAFILILGTAYLARPAVALSGIVFGFGCAGSLVLRGLVETWSLIQIYAPLELLAWLLTIRASNRVLNLYQNMYAHQKPSRLASFAGLVVATFVAYLFAAITEHTAAIGA